MEAAICELVHLEVMLRGIYPMKPLLSLRKSEHTSWHCWRIAGLSAASFVRYPMWFVKVSLPLGQIRYRLSPVFIAESGEATPQYAAAFSELGTARLTNKHATMRSSSFLRLLNLFIKASKVTGS